jgi:hypothetical protein
MTSTKRGTKRRRREARITSDPPVKRRKVRWFLRVRVIPRAVRQVTTHSSPPPDRWNNWDGVGWTYDEDNHFVPVNVASPAVDEPIDVGASVEHDAPSQDTTLELWTEERFIPDDESIDLTGLNCPEDDPQSVEAIFRFWVSDFLGGPDPPKHAKNAVGYFP